MKYFVKKEDISGAITGYPIEIIQAAVDRGVRQGRDASEVLRRLQRSHFSGFTWTETPEGGRFWSSVMSGRNFVLFFTRFPRNLCDGVHYFIVDKDCNNWADVAKSYLGECSRFAFKCNSGALYYIVKRGSITITGFALKDSLRYGWAIENGTEIKY